MDHGGKQKCIGLARSDAAQKITRSPDAHGSQAVSGRQILDGDWHGESRLACTFRRGVRSGHPMRANASSKGGEANVERRAFMQTIAAMVLSSIASGRQQGQMTTVETRGDVPYRTLGKTGVHVSMIGMGGFHLGQKSLTEQDAIRLIHTAIDRGINFMDNSWDYNDGTSEIRMGKALQGGYRDKVFLMTKLDGRTREEAARQIDESLKRLQTDHLDLLQHHEVIRFEDPDRIFAKDGAMEAVLEAKKAGKVRFIGFTGHKDPHV